MVAPLPAILDHIHGLLALYPMDNIKQLATICGKIQERSIYEEVYKILTDCELLIEKIFEINPILPSINHIPVDALIQICLRVRRMELKNWKGMLDLKQRRIHISDMLELPPLFKILKQITN